MWRASRAFTSSKNVVRGLVWTISSFSYWFIYVVSLSIGGPLACFSLLDQVFHGIIKLRKKDDSLNVSLLAYYHGNISEAHIKNTKTVGAPMLGGHFSLVNMQGRPVTDADYRGKFTMYYFGFTRCPDVCPNELVRMGEVMEELSMIFVCIFNVFLIYFRKGSFG